MNDPQGSGDERLERIETGLERIEVALEKSIHAQDLQFGKLANFQLFLMESQNSAWGAIDAVNKGLDGVNKTLGEKIARIAELQKATDEKLNILIDTISHGRAK